MKKLLAFCLVAAIAVPTMAFANGVDLTWNDCVLGTAGTGATNKVFGCTAAANQTYTLYLQVKPPVDIPDFVAFTGVVDLKPTTAGPLAPFWHYETGGCNRGAIPGVAVFDVIPLSCQDAGYGDFAGGDGTAATEGIAAYFPDYQATPGRGTFVIIDARSSAEPMALVTGANYYCVHMNFNNRNRTACAGCNQQVAMVFNDAILEGNATPAVHVSGADKGSDCATINTAPVSQCLVVPVQSTSWGKVKSLFR